MFNEASGDNEPIIYQAALLPNNEYEEAKSKNWLLGDEWSITLDIIDPINKEDADEYLKKLNLELKNVKNLFLIDLLN